MSKIMDKMVSVQRILLLNIALTGDAERDLIALEAYDFEGLHVMSTQKRDMIIMSHAPKIFYNGPEGVFSHSLGEDNVLSIWQESICVEDNHSCRI